MPRQIELLNWRMVFLLSSQGELLGGWTMQSWRSQLVSYVPVMPIQRQIQLLIWGKAFLLSYTRLLGSWTRWSKRPQLKMPQLLVLEKTSQLIHHQIGGHRGTIISKGGVCENRVSDGCDILASSFSINWILPHIYMTFWYFCVGEINSSHPKPDRGKLIAWCGRSCWWCCQYNLSSWVGGWCVC